jgi:hypothetical protein
MMVVAVALYPEAVIVAVIAADAAAVVDASAVIE